MNEIQALPETPRTAAAFTAEAVLQDLAEEQMDLFFKDLALHTALSQPFFPGRDGAGSETDISYHHAEDFDDDDDTEDEYELDDIDLGIYDKRP